MSKEIHNKELKKNLSDNNIKIIKKIDDDVIINEDKQINNINEEIIEDGKEEEDIEEYKLCNFMFYDEFIKKNSNYLKFDPNFPEDIKITTSTLIITYPIEFNIKNIADKIILSNNFINSIKFGNSTSYYRTIKREEKKRVYSKEKKIKNKKERKRKNFYNHVSLEIDNKRENIKLNIKIFQNNSLQITGLKKISWLFWALNNIFNYMNYKSNEIIFGLPLENLQLNKMEKFFIVMMNCIFNVDFNINLIKLYNAIKNDYNIQFDSGKHCALNISYEYDLGNNKNCDVSVIIYNNGKILMSAKENYEVIIKCYKDISLLLYNHYNDIVLETYIINKNIPNDDDFDENNNIDVDNFDYDSDNDSDNDNIEIKEYNEIDDLNEEE